MNYVRLWKEYTKKCKKQNQIWDHKVQYFEGSEHYEGWKCAHHLKHLMALKHSFTKDKQLWKTEQKFFKLSFHVQ